MPPSKNTPDPAGPPRPEPDADPSLPESPPALGPGADGPDAEQVEPETAEAEAQGPISTDYALAEEPSLRDHLAGVWRDTSPRARWTAAAVAAVLLAVFAGPRLLAAVEGPTDEQVEARAALERAQWAAMRRQSPVELGRTPIEDALGPGDAERDDDRYADYYVHQADSSAFSVLVTSEVFAPDLAVRLPDGRTVAASDLLRTAGRAEIDGLQGPGRFEVVVTSRETRATGAYQLAVVPAGPIDSVYVDDEPRLDVLQRGPLRAGRYERAYGVSTGSETPVIVRVVSSAFRPRVHLFGPNGEVRGAWQTLERSSRGDSLHGVVLRYLPGWDAPYRLVVSSEGRGRTGPFAIDVQSVLAQALPTDGAEVLSTLGDGSWLEGARYVDTYTFQAGAGERSTLELRSETFPPAFRVWRVDRRSRKDVTADLNTVGAGALRYQGAFDAGEYYLEVTAGGPDSLRADGQPIGGDYAVSLRSERPEPPPPAPPSAAPRRSGPSPPSKVFSTEVRRTGQSGGSTFEVGVTNVAVSYPGTARTRVQLSVTVRSIDYTGNWAPWESFAGQSYVVDDRGRRYAPSVAESQSPSGPDAEPGTARRGTVVYYLPGVADGLQRLVLVASIGDRSVTLPIPVP